MFVVDNKQDGPWSLPAAELSPTQARAMATPLAQRILALLAQKESYPKEIARRLRVHEQKVYYHIKCLTRAKLIKPVRREYIQGAHASYYAMTSAAFVIRFASMQPAQKMQERAVPEVLRPFIHDGRLDALIVVGSPDPHGPEMARSRDGHYALDLSMFIGTFITYSPQLSVKLDTDVDPQDLQRNLILIGGPIVNAITGRINAKLPIKFDPDNKWAITSTISKKVYASEATGLVVRMQNPWKSDKEVLVVAGTRHVGTRGVVLSFLKHVGELSEGNLKDPSIPAKVVQGIDVDGDGVVDDARILE